MPQSLAQIYLHIIFSTKNRAPLLQAATSRIRVHQYLAGICNSSGSPAIEVGGVEDHVHILCRLGKTESASNFIQTVKQSSSRWIKQEIPNLGEFYWQRGYGAFSVSPSHVPALRAYIRNQDTHHKTESFQDEFRRLCMKYGVALDERYAWD